MIERPYREESIGAREAVVGCRGKLREVEMCAGRPFQLEMGSKQPFWRLHRASGRWRMGLGSGAIESPYDKESLGIREVGSGERVVRRWQPMCAARPFHDEMSL